MTDIAGLIERLNRLALTTFDTDHPEDEDLFREAATALAELQGKLEAAKKRVEVLEQMDREAATYVESVICMRSNRFTGETPYVGWKGLGLALTEDYADLSRLKALLAEAGEWEPQFDAMVPVQEQLAIKFCSEIAGRKGEKGSPPDPVRLLEMAHELYKAERAVFMEKIKDATK